MSQGAGHLGLLLALWPLAPDTWYAPGPSITSTRYWRLFISPTRGIPVPLFSLNFQVPAEDTLDLSCYSQRSRTACHLLGPPDGTLPQEQILILHSSNNQNRYLASRQYYWILKVAGHAEKDHHLSYHNYCMGHDAPDSTGCWAASLVLEHCRHSA